MSGMDEAPSQPGDSSFLGGSSPVQEIFKKVAWFNFCASSDKVSELAFNGMFALLPSEAIVVLGVWHRE